MGTSRLGRGRSRGIGPIDAHIGSRLRVRRTLLGMNQTNLGDALGIAYQQIQQYEKGTNRISASRLYDLSRVLDVPIAYFFDDMSSEVAANSPAQGGGKAKKPPSHEPDPMQNPEILNFVRAYYKIEDTRSRKGLYGLTKALGAAASKDS